MWVEMTMTMIAIMPNQKYMWNIGNIRNFYIYEKYNILYMWK